MAEPTVREALLEDLVTAARSAIDTHVDSEPSASSDGSGFHSQYVEEQLLVNLARTVRNRRICRREEAQARETDAATIRVLRLDLRRAHLERVDQETSFNQRTVPLERELVQLRAQLIADQAALRQADLEVDRQRTIQADLRARLARARVGLRLQRTRLYTLRSAALIRSSTLIREARRINRLLGPPVDDLEPSDG